MSVQFKFKNNVAEDRRREIVNALGRAGFAARSLFPNQKRPNLASIFTVSEAKEEDVKALQTALTDYSKDLEYVEPAPKRNLKA
jgi:hypothetical protein